jgi:hypothetical protein
MTFKKVIGDFEWVMKILESAENKTQMDVVERCFRLWELKHITKNTSVIDMASINNLRRNFWVVFKNKNSKVGQYFV